MTTVESFLSQVETEYCRLTPTSRSLYERATVALPGGDTRQTVFFKPYPLFIDSGSGAYVWDVDGNRLLDCSNCWTALILGHAHPAVVEAVSEQLAKGTAFTAPNRYAHELAEMIMGRVPSIEKMRFANSGTEATMFCVRTARAFTGRSKIVKMLGAYHGSYDDFEVLAGQAPRGIKAGTSECVLEVPFNDKEAATRTLETHGEDIAAVIVEPVMGAAGMLAAEDGYLEHLRLETAKRTIMLILDEIISFRLALGGAQELYSVKPDLTALGKIIGGGFPIGAFGGREDLMQQFSPLNPNMLHHSGTFSGNPISLVAGIATLQQVDASVIAHINGLGERFAERVAHIAQSREIPLQVTGAGSLRVLFFSERRPRHAVEALAIEGGGVLRHLLHLKLLSEEVLAPRGAFNFSAVMTESDLDLVLGALDRALEWLEPAIRTLAPK